jgi:hypothetical protein
VADDRGVQRVNQPRLVLRRDQAACINGVATIEQPVQPLEREVLLSREQLAPAGPVPLSVESGGPGAVVVMDARLSVMQSGCTSTPPPHM